MDVYSFAIIAYNLLTRKRPSSYLITEGKTNDWKVIKKQYFKDITLKEIRPPLVSADENNNIEKVLVETIKRSWVHDPKDRSSMNENRKILEKELLKYSQYNVMNSALKIIKYKENEGKNNFLVECCWTSYSSG